VDAADLKICEAVAHTGSMNKATAVLHTTSNVTARIQAPEAEGNRPWYAAGLGLTAASQWRGSMALGWMGWRGPRASLAMFRHGGIGPQESARRRSA
jgi:hypothetical protein